MKLIEAMKKVKTNKEKIADLQGKILANAAHLSFENPVYGNEQAATVKGWVQAALDISKDNIALLTSISKTNLATPITIDINGIAVTKTIAEWVWRRREYAAVDLATAQRLNDRNLKEGNLPSTQPGQVGVPATIVRYYDPKWRDSMVAAYAAEPGLIDAALEVANAITGLKE